MRYSKSYFASAALKPAVDAEHPIIVKWMVRLDAELAHVLIPYLLSEKIDSRLFVVVYQGFAEQSSYHLRPKGG
jgi:hypothetical protein